MRQELLEQTSQPLVMASVEALNAAGFKAQATPRAINLFYLNQGMRERIVLEDGQYKALNTNLVWSKQEILDLLAAHPEYFSPNVVMRPLFQELILPNLAYVGGGGELAYWLERRTQFEHLGIPYPMLVRRNSVLWLDKDAQKKLAKFGFSALEFFEDTDALIRTFIETNAAGEVSLLPEIQAIAQIYEQIAAKAAAVDPTLDKAVKADASKTAAGLEQWQARLIKAEKQRHEVTLNQIRALKEKLFPGNGLQERSENFLAYYLKYGPGYFDTLLAELDAFDPGFIILSEN
jgi:bacillithiol biosynthesis cysteine-adding enzyme BshC